MAWRAVYSDGRVCISILHPPGEDPNNYETQCVPALFAERPPQLSALLTCRAHRAERWSPVQSVEKILLSVVSMLAGAGCRDVRSIGARFSSLMRTEPNDESSANVEAAVRLRRRRRPFFPRADHSSFRTAQKLWRTNRAAYDQAVRDIVRRSLGF